MTLCAEYKEDQKMKFTKEDLIIMQVEKKWLLLIAGTVWLIAGINIMRIGVMAFHGTVMAVSVLLSGLVFLLFHNFVFRKMVKKHTKRIYSYENAKQSVFKFFNKQAYMIMFFMITFGITLRMSHILPEVFIAIF
ncbi:MAG: hypothetical protein RR396_06915, partial [Clostridiales bacterium]